VSSVFEIRHSHLNGEPLVLYGEHLDLEGAVLKRKGSIYYVDVRNRDLKGTASPFLASRCNLNGGKPEPKG
jgi:hypothetical protein